MLFVKNEGQWTPEVQYKAELTIGSFILEKDKLSFLLHNLGHTHSERVKQKEKTLNAHFYKIGFVGASPSAIVPTDISATYFNYFIGNDSKKWRSNVKAYAAATFKDLYNGIDLRVKGNSEGIVYDFVIQPGADPNQLVQKYEGIEKITLRKNEINYKTSVGEVIEKNIEAYQFIQGKKTSVKCMLNSTSELSFTYTFPDGYDKNEVLIIDPTIVFSTHVGSTADSWGYTATYDAGGNMYLGGYVNATDAGTNFYPTTPGAFQATWGGGTGGNTAPGSGNGNGIGFSCDMGITKLNPSGTARVYSTYIGGRDNEAPNSLIVDAQGNLGIYGTTYSSNFPVTVGAYDATYNGSADIVVTKLNATGTALIGSTYMGGSGMDGINYNPREETPGNLKQNYGDQNRGEINTDANGNLYVASCTYSTNFPVSPGASQASNAGALDGCVFKLNNDCSQLIYSTYIGGSSDDACYSLNLDVSGGLYIAGGTMSSNFPTKAGALNTTYKGGLFDGFVALLNPTGTAILNSTFIGTSGKDQVYFVKQDDAGDVYITGQTTGAYPVINAAYSNPNSGQFITKLNPTLTTVIYSTVFGGGGGKTNISPTAFLVDTCQNVYVSGWGCKANSQFVAWGFLENSLQNVPITNDALQKTTDGNDFYFFVLAKNATTVLYGSYFGKAGVDEHVDGGTSRFDKRGVMYQALCASCGGVLITPTTAGTVSPNRPGANCNILGLKIEFNLGATSVAVNASPRATGCVPLTVQFTSVLYNVQNVLWDFRDGAFSSLTNPVHTFTDTGRYLVKLIGTDPNSCNVSDTAYVEVWVRDDSLEANFSPNIQIDCKQNQVAIASTGGNATTKYLWTLGDGNTATTQTIAHAYASSGSYNVKLVMSDSTRCNLRDSFATQIFIPPTIDLAIVPNDTLGCPPLTVIFDNTTSYTFGDYSWYFGDGDSSTLRTPTHTYQNTGVYNAVVYWFDSTTCNKKDTAHFTITVIDSSADASFVVNRRFFNCDSVQVTVFSNYVGEDSELWIWGDGATSNTNPATHTYKGTTFDTLRHIIVDLKQICHPIDTQIIIISLAPLQTDIDISDTLGCVPFTTTFTGVSPLATTRYFWFFGDGDSASGTMVTHTFVDTGTYRILQVSIDSNACVNIDSNYATVVVIDDFVIALFDVNTINDCDSDLYVQMVDQSIHAVEYLWDFGDGTTASTAQNPDHHYYLPGTYTITLIVTDTTRCHPLDTISRIVTLKPNAVADFTLADVCDGAAVKFTNTSTQANATYSWSFGDNTFDTLTNPVHTYGTSGTYIVNLAIRDTASCNVVDTVAKPVIVYAQPIANFILTRDTYKFEEDIYLQNTSINANTYNWSFGDDNTSTDFSPTYQYKKSIGWHQICLEAYILNAPCRDTICDSVFISFIPLIGVPNAFSPNGDGINDRVFVEGRGIVALEFRIFNRWGQQVYYSTDQKEGWDGVYKGERQELEVYTYLVRARFINEVRKELKGNITLLR